MHRCRTQDNDDFGGRVMSRQGALPTHYRRLFREVPTSIIRPPPATLFTELFTVGAEYSG